MVDGVRLWQADYRDAAGVRRRRFVGSVKAEAERVLSKLIRERDLELSGLAREQGLDVPAAELAAQYVGDLATRGRPKTVHDARLALDRILKALRIRTARDITRPRILEYRAIRLRDGVCHKTINTETATLHAALNLAVRLGQLPTNPISGMRALPVTEEYRRRLPRAFTEQEITGLFHAAEAIDKVSAGIPRTPLMRTLLSTGARWGELSATTWGDLDCEELKITFRAETTKSKKTRRLPISPELFDVLMDLRARTTLQLGREPGQHEAIFLAPRGQRWPKSSDRYRRFLHAAMERAGIQKRDAHGRVVHIHALRHTFATRLMRQGVPIAVAVRLMGHADHTMLLAIYAHPDDDDMRAAILSLPRLDGRGSLTRA